MSGRERELEDQQEDSGATSPNEKDKLRFCACSIFCMNVCGWKSPGSQIKSFQYVFVSCIYHDFAVICMIFVTGHRRKDKLFFVSTLPFHLTEFFCKTQQERQTFLSFRLTFTQIFSKCICYPLFHLFSLIFVCAYFFQQRRQKLRGPCLEGKENWRNSRKTPAPPALIKKIS